jgi:hypothetical protein
MNLKRFFSKKTEKITDDDYKQFEKLFNKISADLNHPISICQGINDGYTIGIYNEKTGDLKIQAMSYDIKNCIKIIKEDLKS